MSFLDCCCYLDGVLKQERQRKKASKLFLASLCGLLTICSLSPFLPGQQNECVHIQSLTKVFLLLNYIKNPSLKIARALLALPNPTSINLTITELGGTFSLFSVIKLDSYFKNYQMKYRQNWSLWFDMHWIAYF